MDKTLMRDRIIKESLKGLHEFEYCILHYIILTEPFALFNCI